MVMSMPDHTKLFYDMRYRHSFNEVEITRGDAEGTEIRIILKKVTGGERAVVFASTGGFGQHGFYNLGIFRNVFGQLLDLAKGSEASVNFVREHNQEPLKALVVCTLAQGSEFYTKQFGDRNNRGPLWRDYYYSMYYAAIELLATNFFTRIHTGAISEFNYQPAEIKCAIEAFIHYARRSKHQKLELVIGGHCYFNHHQGGYSYLESIQDFINEALVSNHTPVKTTESIEHENLSPKVNDRFGLQRRIVHVPLKVSPSFKYSDLVIH